jgi:xanthine dehydrogenase accessory factor
VREILTEILDAWHSGRPVGVGTVIATWRSAPRPAGASMVVGTQGEVAGSVSGGCVEGAVYDLAQEVMRGGGPVLERYGVSDEDAFSVGLTCGGILDVFVERIDRISFPEFGSIAADIEAGRPVAVATLVAHPDPARIGRRLVVRPHRTDSADGRAYTLSGSLGSVRMDTAVGGDARGALAAGLTKTLTYGSEGERLEAGARVFVASYVPPPRMIVFGAIDFAQALSRMGSFLGYHVTVCDARPVFTTRSRFPDADEVVVDWPHRYLAAEAAASRVDDRTVIAVLTHDPKFDVPLLEIALRLPEIRYIGAMGSRRTHDGRLARLREAGLSDEELSRMSSPLGLDLGARTPEETAVSIAAEIIAMSWGGKGTPLSAHDGPIHRQSMS